jgi:hypothetical protein
MNSDVNYESFGGWSISKELFDWILSNLPKGSTILELGSGGGTKELVKFYNVYSVEHDIKWVDLVPESTYIHAPLVDGWYDVEILKDKLPKEYDLLLIDGPIGENRINIINHYDIFNKNIPIIIDDTNRENDKNMSLFLSEKFDKRITFSIDCDDKTFTILY